MLEWVLVKCPYCGEPFETSVDCSAGGQTYVEDCMVCCSPIVFLVSVELDGNLSAVTTRREDE